MSSVDLHRLTPGHNHLISWLAVFQQRNSNHCRVNRHMHLMILFIFLYSLRSHAAEGLIVNTSSGVPYPRL
jgi:hypothetical protein